VHRDQQKFQGLLVMEIGHQSLQANEKYHFLGFQAASETVIFFLKGDVKGIIS
jgi:hypothetical protein